MCRGVQVVNVAAGGTVHQDLAADLPGSIKHDYFPSQGPYSRDLLVHEVRIAEGTKLGRLLQTPSIRVNSIHPTQVDTDMIQNAPTPSRPTAW